VVGGAVEVVGVVVVAGLWPCFRWLQLQASNNIEGALEGRLLTQVDPGISFL
jgi:hypothetical protein